MPRLIDPAQIPTFPEVNVEGLRSVAHRMRREGEGIRNTARELAEFWRGGLDPVYSAPEAPDLLEALMPLVPRGAEVADNSQRSARAAEMYADELERLKKQGLAVREDARVFEARMRALGDDWDKDQGNVAENDRFWGEKSKLDAAFEHAGGAAAQAVRAASVGEGGPYGPYAGAGTGPLASEKELRALADAHAKGIKQALAGMDPEQARRALAFYADIVRRLQGQPVYLEHLYGQAGTEIAGMGRWLGTHPADDRPPGRLFTPGDGAILGGFGAGLAALSHGKNGASIPPALRRTLLSPKGDKFSHGLLLKFGPDAKKWDPKFLGDMGKTMLQWQRENPIRPPIPGMRGPEPPPSERAWWEGLTVEGGDPADLDDIIKQYDPVAATLDKVSDSPDASRYLTADKGAAKDLVSNPWKITAPSGNTVDLSRPASEVILAATADKSHPGSVRAALNLFNAAAHAPADMNARAPWHPPEAPPPNITRALAVMGVTYIDQIASAPSNTGDSTILPGGKELELSKDDLRGYLSILAKDPTALGHFRGGIDREITNVVSGEANGNLRNLGQLHGMSALAQSNENYEDAQMRDAVNARSLQLLEWALGSPVFPDLPEHLKDPAAYAAWITDPGSDALKGTIFDTGHGARAAFENERQYEKAALNLRIPVAQGMLDAVESGEDKWPQDRAIPNELVRDGRIHLKDKAAYATFNNWFESLGEGNATPYNKYLRVKPGFEDETVNHKDTWYGGR